MIKVQVSYLLNVVPLLIDLTPDHENIVGKGENSGKENLLLVPQCFLSYKSWISSFEQYLTLYHKIPPYENIVWKGENADKQHFLLFSQCFLPIQKKKSSF